MLALAAELDTDHQSARQKIDLKSFPTSPDSDSGKRGDANRISAARFPLIPFPKKCLVNSLGERPVEVDATGVSSDREGVHPFGYTEPRDDRNVMIARRELVRVRTDG